MRRRLYVVRLARSQRLTPHVPAVSEDESEDEDEDEDDGEAAPQDGLQTPSGLETPSGLASVTSTVPGGLETPDFLELRKRRDETEPDAADASGPRELYQVLPERESRMRGFMGSDRVYDVSALGGGAGAGAGAGGVAPPVLGQEERGTKRKAGGVDVALDAGELEGLSEADLRARYEQANRAGRAGGGTHEDFSDFAAAEVAKRRKMAENKKREGGGGGSSKEKFRF